MKQLPEIDNLKDLDSYTIEVKEYFDQRYGHLFNFPITLIQRTLKVYQYQLYKTILHNKGNKNSIYTTSILISWLLYINIKHNGFDKHYIYGLPRK